jgi:hypothetical protein
MAISIPSLILGGVLAGGAVAGIEALTNQPKSPSQTAPTTPSQSTANTTAAATVADQRATLLASGGVTDNTGGLGILTGADVKSSSLIGG